RPQAGEERLSKPTSSGGTKEHSRESDPTSGAWLGRVLYGYRISQPGRACQRYQVGQRYRRHCTGGFTTGNLNAMIVIPKPRSEGDRQRDPTAARIALSFDGFESGWSYELLIWAPQTPLPHASHRKVPLSPAFSVRVRDDNYVEEAELVPSRRILK